MRGGRIRTDIRRWHGGVIPLFRDNMTYAPTRIGNIVDISRDDVHVQMVDCLASRLPDIDSYVEAIRTMAFKDLLLGTIGCGSQFSSFLSNMAERTVALVLHDLMRLDMINSPFKPASTQMRQRHLRTGLLAMRIIWQTGQRCSYVLRWATLGDLPGTMQMPGSRTLALNPTACISFAHSAPCGFAVFPHNR